MIIFSSSKYFLQFFYNIYNIAIGKVPVLTSYLKFKIESLINENLTHK